MTTPHPPNAKAIWIASIPRSGSMWAFNITRDLVKSAGCRALPERIPQSDKDMIREFNDRLNDPDPLNITVIKIHNRLAKLPPASRIITTHRDLRDAMVSFQRFMKCDFDTVLKGAIANAKTCDHYRNISENLTMHIKYENIRDNPTSVIQDVGKFLGLTPTSTIVNNIRHRFSKENVGKRINDMEDGIKARLAKGEAINRNEIVPLSQGKARVFDVSSGFQSGHISDYKDGDWRKIFSKEEKARVQEELGNWLAQNGYPPE